MATTDIINTTHYLTTTQDTIIKDRIEEEFKKILKIIENTTDKKIELFISI